MYVYEALMILRTLEEDNRPEFRVAPVTNIDRMLEGDLFHISGSFQHSRVSNSFAEAVAYMHQCQLCPDQTTKGLVILTYDKPFPKQQNVAEFLLKRKIKLEDFILGVSH